LARKLVIGSQLCLQQAMNFNKAQGISWMSSDPLRAGGVWAWGRDYIGRVADINTIRDETWRHSVEIRVPRTHAYAYFAA